MKLSVVSRVEIGSKVWDEFCDSSPWAWFYHTSRRLDYALIARDGKSIDRSFGVYQNERLVAIAPLVEESNYQNKYRYFSMVGAPLPYPAFVDPVDETNRKKIEQFIISENILIAGNAIDYASFLVSSLSENVLNSTLLINPLPKFGFHDTSITSNVLDIRREEGLIFKGFRKGVKADIKAAKKSGCTIKIINKDNYSYEQFKLYQDLHYSAAGGSTRPNATWDAMGEWVRDGYALIALAEMEGTVSAGALVITYKNKAYYGSGAIHADFRNKRGIGHLLQWEIIRFLKLSLTQHYEIGWNWYANISNEVADDKMLGISKFKRGFGADIYPLFRAEHFFNVECMREIYNERLDEFIKLRFTETND